MVICTWLTTRCRIWSNALCWCGRRRYVVNSHACNGCWTWRRDAIIGNSICCRCRKTRRCRGNSSVPVMSCLFVCLHAAVRGERNCIVGDHVRRLYDQRRLPVFCLSHVPILQVWSCLINYGSAAYSWSAFARRVYAWVSYAKTNSFVGLFEWSASCLFVI